MSETIIKVEGMSCNHCVQAVEGALKKISGVKSAKVNLAENNVTVSYDDKEVDVDTLKKAIEDQGYDVP